VVRRSRARQRRVVGVVDRGTGSVKMLRQWRRPPPRAVLLPLSRSWRRWWKRNDKTARVLGGGLGVLKGVVLGLWREPGRRGR
jgi:hypothetical protein